MTTECTHPTRENGVCTTCGQCDHDLILNAACYYCGATDIDPIAISPKKPPALIKPEALVRKKP
ncbi:hypothetical protein BH11MYX2_BH11MYX2_22800 [soil metagenome]